MNSADDVTGWGWRDLNMILPPRAFRYSNAHGYVDLGTLGGSNSYGYGINDDGIVVGTSEVIPGRAGHAFRAMPSLAMEDLGALPVDLPAVSRPPPRLINAVRSSARATPHMAGPHSSTATTTGWWISSGAFHSPSG